MVTLVRANNSSAMTLTGTNSYVIGCGDGAALVIDPGPPFEEHLQALVGTAAAQGLTIAAIVLSHAHPDHAMAAPHLSAATGAPVYAHPQSRAPHDVDLPLESELWVGARAMKCIDAPGHSNDHAIFYLEPEAALFTGDTILGEGTTVIAPPGGALRPYQRTLQRLAGEFPAAVLIYPGHGPVVTDPAAKIAEYIAHRQMREVQVLEALTERPMTIPDLVRRIYGTQRQVLWPAMARQVLAHLVALEGEGRVAAKRLDRPFTEDEAAMLNPRITDFVGPEEAAVIVAELGTEMRLETLYRYRLT
ncbi:MAG TPA: MBL fold metallo-hydrolase [Candidatus Baltobacteraceae bacterium]|jgi:glyoxylase-like metal-dependent hydrolase (beta-lactamase superfamily II)|nr:MBL fold metallo-hydrolase [Candidatus Baltobacteraceae bacterium]